MEERFENIPGRYGVEVERTGPRSVACRLPLQPSLRAADGSMRCAAILMGVDMACGMSAGLGVFPEWTLTADAEVHLLGPCMEGPLRVDARCIRAGRKMSVAEARLVDEGANDRLVAVATGNHGVMTPNFEPPIASMETGARQRFASPAVPETESLEETFGLRLDAGVARIPLSDRSRNPWGILHGGLHGLLIDAVARAAKLEPRHLVLRFMNPVREGDAVARVIERYDPAGPGTPAVSPGGLARIEVVDSANDRVAVLAHVLGSPVAP